jgi:hypothetical protein
MYMSDKSDACAYCGVQTISPQSDHVPPRNLFAKPRPELITVPACSACHRPTSKDDEYFRLVFSLRNQVAAHPDVRGGVQDAALRSLARPRARGLARRFLETVRDVSVYTPSGIYLGNAGTYTVESERLIKVVERIVRGLFFHHQRTALGQHYEVKVFEDSLVMWELLDADVIEQLQSVNNHLSEIETLKLGTAFQYARIHMPEDDRTSAWRLTFYDKVVFLAFTAASRGRQRRDYPPSA